MTARHSLWRLARFTLAVTLSLTFVSGFLYPGGNIADNSTPGYSFSRNFLSDLGGTVAINGRSHRPGAIIFGGAVIISVIVLAGLFVGTIRILRPSLARSSSLGSQPSRALSLASDTSASRSLPSIACTTSTC